MLRTINKLFLQCHSRNLLFVSIKILRFSHGDCRHFSPSYESFFSFISLSYVLVYPELRNKLLLLRICSYDISIGISLLVYMWFNVCDNIATRAKHIRNIPSMYPKQPMDESKKNLLPFLKNVAAACTNTWYMSGRQGKKELNNFIINIVGERDGDCVYESPAQISQILVRRSYFCLPRFVKNTLIIFSI